MLQILEIPTAAAAAAVDKGWRHFGQMLLLVDLPDDVDLLLAAKLAASSPAAVAQFGGAFVGGESELAV